VSFVETVERARQQLERSRRLSLRALSLEFGLDGEQLEALADELVEFQGVAGRVGRALVWLGPAARPLDLGESKALLDELPAAPPAGTGTPPGIR
jgi:hypothetical protein